MYNMYATLFAKSPCVCERPLELRTKTTQKIDDTKIYCFRGGEYFLYQLEAIGQNSVSAYPIETEDWQPLYRVPSFGLVGVFKVGRISDVQETVLISDISGKVIFVDDFAVCVSKIILDEAV